MLRANKTDFKSKGELVRKNMTYIFLLSRYFNHLMQTMLLQKILYFQLMSHLQLLSLHLDHNAEFDHRYQMKTSVIQLVHKWGQMDSKCWQHSIQNLELLSCITGFQTQTFHWQ